MKKEEMLFELLCDYEGNGMERVCDLAIEFCDSEECGIDVSLAPQQINLWKTRFFAFLEKRGWKAPQTRPTLNSGFTWGTRVRLKGRAAYGIYGWSLGPKQPESRLFYVLTDSGEESLEHAGSIERA